MFGLCISIFSDWIAGQCGVQLDSVSLKPRPIGIGKSWKSDQRNFVNFVPQSFKSMSTVEEQRVAAIGVNFPSEDLTFAKIG